MLNCPPTFGMYPFDAALAGAAVISVPRRDDFRVDLRGVEEASRRHAAKLIFLTSPNNPDGSLLPKEDLLRLLQLPLLVVVDEAYIEFAGLEHSVSGWVNGYPNLVVLRTFSKWAGIAGLRLGYGILPDWLMPVMLRAKQPYNVNVAATVAGRTSLAKRAEIQPSIDALVCER